MQKPFIYAATVSIFLLISLASVSRVDAQVASQSSQVSGSIGAFYLNLSGFIAPNASVTLITDNIVLRSTTTDQNGYFYITSVLINRGFSNFCLDAIDFKRLGESYTCFDISPAQDNITMSDIFLPPTLGLQRTELTIGQDAITWGYSMPNALVTIHSSDGKTYVIQADPTGYYQTNFKIASVGKYEFYADATYQNKQSRIPNRKIELTAISIPQNIAKQTSNAAKKTAQTLIASPWGWILLLLVLLALIFFLLRKLKPEWFTFTKFSGFNFHINKTGRQRDLHHAWFIGY